MALTTHLFKTLFLNSRGKKLETLRFFEISKEVQEETLQKLLQKAKQTKFGIDHGFSSIRSVADYQKRVPVRSYEDFFNDYFKPASQSISSYDPLKTSPFLQNVTWPGFIPFYSLSSGTTAGATKYIPLTKELLRGNFQAGIDSLIFHFIKNPKTKVLDAKMFLLGGNTALKEDWNGRTKSGDLSGIAAARIPWFCKQLYFPGKEISGISDWEEKMNKSATEALAKDVSILAGVPSWVMLFLETLNEKCPFKGDIKKIWPAFELYVHGGISFEPYRSEFRSWLGREVYFQEVYAASEAFIGIQDPYEEALRLMVDYGVFYEFIPVGELQNKIPTRLTIADVEENENYALVLTTNGGLWSYLIGDTIRFISKEKLLIKITGRTKFYLSAFGEHLIQEEIERSLTDACKQFNVQLVDYHVAPVFPSKEMRLGKHQYLIEFVNPPRDLAAFTSSLDHGLQILNEDYAAHRLKGFGMDLPEVIVAPAGFFKAWMKEKGKLGGQHKVPRISNERDLLSGMLNFLSESVRF